MMIPTVRATAMALDTSPRKLRRNVQRGFVRGATQHDGLLQSLGIRGEGQGRVGQAGRIIRKRIPF